MGVLGIERVFGHAEATVKRWLLKAARQAQQVTDGLLRGVDAKFIQLDELRTFFANKKQELWVWKSIDCVSKLWLAVHASLSRSNEECKVFIKKTVRVIVRAPLGASTDGLQEYGSLLPKRWRKTAYAQVVKHYEGRKLVSVERRQVSKHTVAEVEQLLVELELGKTLNTSFVERLNATTRAGPARFHRKTLHYSKQPECVTAAILLRQASYNFIRCQQRRKRGFKEEPRTPAMKAGLTPRPWTWMELLSLQPT